jgi:hypothetical protein
MKSHEVGLLYGTKYLLLSYLLLSYLLLPAQLTVLLQRRANKDPL